MINLRSIFFKQIVIGKVGVSDIWPGQISKHYPIEYDKVLGFFLGQMPNIDMNRKQSYEIKVIIKIVLGIRLDRILNTTQQRITFG